MSRPEHSLSQEELMAYVDGQLKGAPAARVAQHLYGCPECAAAVANTRQLSGQIAAWKVEDSPQRIAEHVMAELKVQSIAREGASQGGWWTRGRLWAYGLGGAFAALLLLVTIVTPSLLRSRQSAQEARPQIETKFLAEPQAQQ